MAWYDTLLEQGFVPAGTTPNVIDAQGKMVGKVSTDPLSRLMRTLEAAQLKKQSEAERKQKETNNQLDMYKTLRENGYDPKRAYDAVMSGKMPTEAPGQTMKEQQEEAGLAKTKAETEKIQKGLTTKTKDELENEILDKVAKGMALSPGEQKIYDDVIKKQKRAGDEESLDSILSGGSAAKPAPPPKGKEEMVAVYDPNGTPGYVPASKLAAALYLGYKKRNAGK